MNTSKLLNNKIKILVLFLIIALSFGCSMLKKEYTKLEKGMPKSELLKLLGNPIGYQAYLDPAKRKMEILIFPAIKTEDDDEKMVLRLVMRDELVIGWSREEKEKEK